MSAFVGKAGHLRRLLQRLLVTLSGRGIPIDLAQGAGSKSGLWPFLGLAGAIICISPNPGGPSRIELLRPRVALFLDATAGPKEDVMNSMRRMFLIVSLLLPVTLLASGASSAESKLDATILSYDGTDLSEPERR